MGPESWNILAGTYGFCFNFFGKHNESADLKRIMMVALLSQNERIYHCMTTPWWYYGVVVVAVPVVVNDDDVC